ncbi:ATP-binding protein [Variovorax sp. PCZ-1]|uniref:ATP-binding protein n=1 Tax=Variovorax sp. PCZ-1 TaxID=2835533 RepID=UPI001BCC0CB0|nr:ATP-binding protein [Variovorax sp. PCZ-1]MBS7808387.1 ATP-binding protein [Variovorax sp. PCZ-1]
MEQRSDVEFRAEKLYKNSREKFGYLFREVVSNSIHAALIKTSLQTSKDFKPLVRFTVKRQHGALEICIEDNGEGFHDRNRAYFTSLDSKNTEKEKLNFHPKGQGRLAIVYFSDMAKYSSVYANSSGELNRIEFDYPERSPSLFDLSDVGSSIVNEGITGTTIQLTLAKQQSLGRANTFFNKYSDVNKLAGWFIETFFPFFMENEALELQINIQGDAEPITINKAFIEKNVKRVPFSVKFDGSSANTTHFQMWLVSVATAPKSKNQVTCFARHLQAEIEGGKLEYEIDLPVAYDWRLTSEFFDDNVDQKGDKIEISDADLEQIQVALNQALDTEFSLQITANRAESQKNVENAKAKFQSLSVFIDARKNSETRRILKDADIVSGALEDKGKVERTYWISEEADPEEVGKLLNSSLHIYIHHRGRVLKRLKELVLLYNEEGEEKKERENDVHDLFLRRGNSLKESNGKSHLHNLWILDDKYTIFSETLQASSTKSGSSVSDIYIWADDLEKTKELLILELKSTTSSHNAGDKYESMVAQVKRYAKQFYQNPTKVLNWHVNPENVLYSGVVLARKSDIYRELNSNNGGSSPNKIPFLESSYYFYENFSVEQNATAEPKFMKIRIEMYSYEDIHRLAESRNAVFLKLLKNEFSVGKSQL